MPWQETLSGFENHCPEANNPRVKAAPFFAPSIISNPPTRDTIMAALIRISHH
jgi:hypothetical protein